MIASVIVGMTGAATAGLHIDLRATSVTGSGTLVNNKTVRNAFVGSTVKFDIYATITGTNANNNDDKFISVSGSFRSPSGRTLGTITADVVRSGTDPDQGEIIGFDGLGFSVGTQQDLDFDSDFDVGSNIDSDSHHFWAARYALGETGIVAGWTSPFNGGRRVGFGTFVVTVDGNGGAINFDGRASAVAAHYVQDGVMTQSASFDGLLPIVLVVPEPTYAAAPLLLFAALSQFRTRSRSTIVVRSLRQV